jgi:hypothetical protein
MSKFIVLAFKVIFPATEDLGRYIHTADRLFKGRERLEQ